MALKPGKDGKYRAGATCESCGFYVKASAVYVPDFWEFNPKPQEMLDKRLAHNMKRHMERHAKRPQSTAR